MNHEQDSLMITEFNAEPEDKVEREGDSEPEGFSGFEDQARVTDFQQTTSATRSTIRNTTSPEEGAKSSRKRRTPVIESDLKGTPSSDFSKSRINKSSRPIMLDDMVSQSPLSIPISSDDEPFDSDEESLEPQPKRRKGSGAIPFDSDEESLEPQPKRRKGSGAIPFDSDEESLEPQPKRRKGSGAIPFDSDEESLEPQPKRRKGSGAIPFDSDEESLEPQPKRRKGSGAIPFDSISPRSTSSTSTIKDDRAESVVTLSPPDSHIVSININVPSATAIATSRIVPATVLRQAFFGAAQTLKYRGPRNPISQHMRFPEEQTSSDEEGRRVMWTEDWWSELHEINGVELKAGEKGNNLVKERSRELGGNKKG
ncbi:hypothetical protein E2P81_ATG02895 [Venturia nashicola]|nr:hypothetical protein E2P81_ATG02895 [Venturia nashicola]